MKQIRILSAVLQNVYSTIYATCRRHLMISKDAIPCVQLLDSVHCAVICDCGMIVGLSKLEVEVERLLENNHLKIIAINTQKTSLEVG